jgi:aspartyl-tRNA synthetase
MTDVTDSMVADASAATALRTHRCGELGREQVGETVRLGGWVHRRRDLGGLVFIDLRDRAGIVQLSCDPRWTSPEVMARAAGAGTESVVLVEGTVDLRPEMARDTTLAPPGRRSQPARRSTRRRCR